MSQTRELSKTIGFGHGVALYVSAVLGAGVLALPGQIAGLAGPASLLSWGFACLMGVPLAVLFARLARRHPDAGGVATYVRHAFGGTAGGLAGWLYFAAGSVGQAVVPLTGGYYVADALGLGDAAAYAIAGAILLLAVVANLGGLRLGARLQLALAAAVAVFLAVTAVLAIPRMDVDRLTPFAPHGFAAVGAGVVVLFFAFAGWEAVAHLAGEFRDPDRDVPRAVGATVVVVSVLYLGLAAAVVLTGTYGTPAVDHVAVTRILQDALGGPAVFVAAAGALVISLGTANAFVAGISRLAYSLAGDGWLPRSVGRRNRHGVPAGGVLAVAGIAVATLALAAAAGWGTEQLVVVPSVLVVAVYLLAACAGARLLAGLGRAAAVVTVLATVLVVPSVTGQVLIPVTVVVLALLVRAGVRAASARRG